MKIAQLIKSPECKTLEFKRDLSSPQSLLKTLTAFAYTAGGRIIIGGLSLVCCSPDEPGPLARRS